MVADLLLPHLNKVTMDEKESAYEKVCPRCGVYELYDHPGHTQCLRCDARDKEERDAWVRFASVLIPSYDPASGKLEERTHLNSTAASLMLGEFKKCFPYPVATSLASSLKAITTPLGGECVDDFGNDQMGEAANAE